MPNINACGWKPKIVDVVGIWYQGTWAKNIPSIEREGFHISFEYPEQYTNGIYLLGNPWHPRIRSYGDAILAVDVRGTFIDAPTEYDWYAFYDKYAGIHDPREQYDAIRADYPYPDVDGIRIDIGGDGQMLVAWNTHVLRAIGRYS